MRVLIGLFCCVLVMGMAGQSEAGPTSRKAYDIQKRLLYLATHSDGRQHRDYAARHRKHIKPLLPYLLRIVCDVSNWKSTYFAGQILALMPKQDWVASLPSFVEFSNKAPHKRGMVWFWGLPSDKQIRDFGSRLVPKSFRLPAVRALVLGRVVVAHRKAKANKQASLATLPLLRKGLVDSSILVRTAAARFMLQASSLAREDWQRLANVFVRDHKHTPMHDAFALWLEKHKVAYSLFKQFAKKAKAVHKASFAMLIRLAKPKPALRVRIGRAYLSAASLKKGKSLYRTKTCGVCHGASGAGLIGPNLTDLYSILGVTFVELYNVISLGGRKGKGMMGYKSTMTKAELIDLTAYVASLKKKRLVGKKPGAAAKKRSIPAYLKPGFRVSSSMQAK
jgi:mono/diheme cytochrome c family protein